MCGIHQTLNMIGRKREPNALVRPLLVASAVATVLVLASCSSSGGDANGSTSGEGGDASSGAPAASVPDSYQRYGDRNEVVASVDAENSTAVLNITGGVPGKNRSYNYEGYANGNLILRIPAGWEITVKYSVESETPHSIAIVPWDQRQGGYQFSDAFDGAHSANPTTGIGKGDETQTFSFTADTPGKYAIVCEVPGHTQLGMWDQLNVVEGLDEPEAYVT